MCIKISVILILFSCSLRREYSTKATLYSRKKREHKVRNENERAVDRRVNSAERVSRYWSRIWVDLAFFGEDDTHFIKVAGFTVAVNNGTADRSDYYVERLQRQHLQQQQEQRHQQKRTYNQQPQLPRLHAALSSHSRDISTKNVLEASTIRNDLVYVHCATTDEDELEEEDEPETNGQGIMRSRSWLCCPGDRDRADQAVPIRVEADTSRQNVSPRRYYRYFVHFFFSSMNLSFDC